MVRATKATKQRLKKMKNSTLAEILLEHIVIAENISDCLKDGFILGEDDYSKGFYAQNYLYIKAVNWEKPYFKGFETKYPKLIQTTLTHGNNEVIIPDINKMTKTMQD